MIYTSSANYCHGSSDPELWDPAGFHIYSIYITSLHQLCVILHVLKKGECIELLEPAKAPSVQPFESLEHV